MRGLVVAAVGMHVAAGDLTANVERLDHSCRARAPGAEIVLFPALAIRRPELYGKIVGRRS